GTTYKGNVFNGHTSTTGGTADAVNNYEAVFLPPGTSGAITVRVIPSNIAGDGVPNSGDATDQDFALVISNGLEEPTFTVNAEPESQQICTLDESAASYSVAVGSILGFSTPVNLSFTGTPGGASGSLASTTVNPGSSTTLDFSSLNAAAAGTYTINVSGTDGADVRDDAVSLKLTTADAGAASLTAPANGAIGFAIGGAFTWAAGSQADEYLLEVATDAGFTNVIRSALVTATTANFVGNELPSNSVLYWRVTSANICGSTTSAVRSFTTEALPGDCPLGTDVVEIATDNLESGAIGWTHSGTGDTWALSTTRNHSPANSFKGTDSATVSDQRLVTPAYSLPTGDTGYSLTYWSFHAFEGTGTSCWDGGLLEVSTNGGTNWTQVPTASLLTDPYDGAISTAWGNPLGGLNAWCRSQDWTRSVVDLNAYAGQNVQFRFRLGSDSSVGAEGWYVDDLRVQSCRVASTNLIFRNGFE
ncbi:MAG TPA: choice-of-anchor J domain-containing protein, partial [Aquimonas sp.]|nr:choice-of-anchor J domain-containing protein [Aquimonas sp.]